MNTLPHSTKAELLSIAPQFVVPDVVATAEYYRDRLGFTILGYFAEPPIYAIVKRGMIEIHFGKGDSDSAQSNLLRRKEGLDAYIVVNNVDLLFEEFTERNAVIIEPPNNTVYEMREIVVDDCNGFRIAFGQDISNASTAPKT